MRKVIVGSWVALSFVFGWIFREYLPSKLFEYAFGRISPIVADRLGVTESQIIGALQTAIVPTAVAAVTVWGAYKLMLWVYSAGLTSSATERSSSTVPLAAGRTRSLVPDMPIHDLFFHIRADLLENASEKRWEAVARDVMDRFSTGQLMVWGREINKFTRRGEALTVIPQDYWRNRTFVYTFFGEDKGIGVLNGAEIAHTYSYQDAHALQYADLQVNRMQAFGIWPQRFKDVIVRIRASEPRRNQSDNPK